MDKKVLSAIKILLEYLEEKVKEDIIIKEKPIGRYRGEDVYEVEIPCECGSIRFRSDNTILTSMPPQIKVTCIECGRVKYKVL